MQDTTKIYKTTFLNSIISINDYNTHAIAANLYDKIKRFGILPSWIKREKRIDRVTVFSDPTIIGSEATNPILDDDRFTFGRGISNGVYYLSQDINLGKVHEISFEVIFSEGETLPFEYRISSTNLIYHEFTLPEEFCTIKIVRDHFNIDFYLNGELDLSTTLPLNDDYVFSGEFANILSPNFALSNLKIERGSNILHWWKLNTFKTIEVNTEEILFTCNQIMFNEYLVYNPQIIVGNCRHEFIDEGFNSKDFYSFWYTICFVFALIISYSKTLLFLRDSSIKSKFLQLKGIFTGSVTSEDLSSLYTIWRDSFKERGTDRILLKKDAGSGVGRRLSNQDFLEIANSIDIGVNHTIGFDIKIIDGDTNLTILDIVKFIKDGDEYSLEYSLSEPVIHIFESNDDFFRVKITKSVNEIIFEVNDSISFYTIEPTLSSIVSNVLCKSNSGNDFAIANIKISSELLYLTYPLSEKYSLFNLPLSGYYNYEYIARIDSDIREINLSNSFYLLDDFSNKYNQRTDGEYLRATRYTDGEFTGGFISGVDFGWWMGSSSICHNTSYKIPSFNKIFHKPVMINSYAELPYVNQELITIDHNYLEIDSETSVNTPNGINFSNYSSIDKFKIPVNHLDSYEFRFNIKVTENQTGFRFGLMGLNSQGGLSYFKDAKTGALINSSIAYFHQSDNFIYNVEDGHDYDLLIIGKINSSSSTHSSIQTLNIGVGRNLIMGDSCLYICPVIEIFTKEEGVSKKAYLSNLFLGLSTFPIGRGYLGYKNVFVIKSENKSEDEYLSNKIDEVLIPYNTVSKIIV